MISSCALFALQAKGGAFTGEEKDFFRFRLGEQSVIPGFEEAVAGMRVGGVRRVIVPEELGYPGNDYNKLGPKPTTFSGEPQCHAGSGGPCLWGSCTAAQPAAPWRSSLLALPARRSRLSFPRGCRAAGPGLRAGQQGHDRPHPDVRH